MARFLIRRIGFAFVLLVCTSSAALFLTRLAPGDVTSQLGAFAPRAEVEAARARFDLDRNPVMQWGRWMSRAVRLDFGDSFLYNQPVGPLVVRAAGHTAHPGRRGPRDLDARGDRSWHVHGKPADWMAAGCRARRVGDAHLRSAPADVADARVRRRTNTMAAHGRHGLGRRDRSVVAGVDRRRGVAPRAAGARARAARLPRSSNGCSRNRCRKRCGSRS